MSSPHAAALYRSIRPAGEGERNPSPPSQKKRKITAVACLQCQRKRCKCDGLRPRCSACVVAGSRNDCTYETRGDQSRAGALKERNNKLELEVTRLRSLLQTSRGKSASADAAPTSMFNSPTNEYLHPGLQYGSKSPSPASNITTPTSSNERQAPSDRSGSEHNLYPLPRSEKASRATSNGQDGRSEPTMSPEGYNADSSWHGKVERLQAEIDRLKSVIKRNASMYDESAATATQHGGGAAAGSWKHLRDMAVPPEGLNMNTIDPNDLTLQPQLGPGVQRRNMASPEDHTMSPPPRQDSYLQTSAGTGRSSSGDPLAGGGAYANHGLHKRRSKFPDANTYVHKKRLYGNHIDVFGNLPFSSAIMANYQPIPIQETQITTLQLPTHLIQMLNTEDHLSDSHNVLSPEFASSSFHSFRSYARHLIAQGAPSEGVVGPVGIDVRPFFNTEHYNTIIHTASTFAPWFLGAYPSMTLPSKVACALIISMLLRWQISPTRENFDAMPEWLKATGFQIFVPHISAYDFMPWPQIRDYLIEDGKTPENEVIVAIISNLQIDWPQPIESVFMWDSESGAATGVSPSFEEHVRNINNWGINSKLLPKYPFLKGMARFVTTSEELE